MDFGMVETQEFLWGRKRDEASLVKQGDARAEKNGLADVMRDENNGFVQAADEGTELPLKFGPSDGIEGTEGLVQKKNGRVCRESAGDANALTLAAGKFPGVARGKLRGIETY